MRALLMMLKVSDVMRELNISRTAAYQLMHQLGAIRFGERGMRLPAERLKRFVESQRRFVPPLSHEVTPEPIATAEPEGAPKVGATPSTDRIRSVVEKACARARRPSNPAPPRSRTPPRIAKAVARARLPE